MILKSLRSYLYSNRHVPLLIRVSRMSTKPVNISIHAGLKAADPEQRPVLIVGQAPHLNSLSWSDVRCKLEPRISEEAWRRGVSLAAGSAGEAVELWARAASVAALGARCSRHAAPARPAALAKLARHLKVQPSASIVLVCRKRDLFASCLALARSFPLFCLRSSSAPLPVGPPSPSTAADAPDRDLSIEILLVKDDGGDVDSEDEGEVPSSLQDTTLSSADLQLLQTAADCTRRAACIVDTPPNLMHIDQIIQEAFLVAKELDIAPPTVIRGEELKERGMGGLYGVGQASTSPPALVVLSYRPPEPSAHSVAWVGKGIVYDTGGLSIKSRTSMVGMKGDCAGAAGVLGAFRLAAAARAAVPLHAVLCLAENCVGPNATRPDDIHRLYSGRTVEINNTDAEGRLVLSDGVVYAQRDLKATVIVDMATLTGAQGSATGKQHAAVLSNSGRLERAAVRAGRAAGEAAHAVPFAPELHFPEYASHVADMKNSVADRGNAQVSCAGLFMLAHLGFDFPGRWLHIDMASPAVCGERATGYGVGILPVLFGHYTHSDLLRALSPGPGVL